MSENVIGYKWKAVFDDPRRGEGFRLEPLPPANGLSNSYIHKPGDIDYYALNYLSYEVKTDIMHYIHEGCAPDDSKKAAIQIAACILVDKMTAPKFLPKELLPIFWKW